MKKILIFVLIGISTVSMLTGCGCSKKEKEEVEIVNTNEGVIKDQKVDTFRFQNTSLIYKSGTSTLETTVTNISEVDQNIQEFEIIFKDKKGNEIATLTGYIGGNIAPMESRVITSYCDENLAGASSIEYKILR